jgi:hypothetical protein
MTGLYRHYKGNVYRVLHVAMCVETKTDVVVYQPAEGGQVWVRDADQWNELVTSPANPKIKIPRFEKVV